MGGWLRYLVVGLGMVGLVGGCIREKIKLTSFGSNPTIIPLI